MLIRCDGGGIPGYNSFFYFIENFKIIIKKLYNNELKII